MGERQDNQSFIDELMAKAQSENYAERQRALDSFLDRLAKNELVEYKETTFNEFFKQLYKPAPNKSDGFRHQYAAIYRILEENSAIDQSNQTLGIVANGVVDYLSSIKDSMPDDEDGKRAKKGLFKLIDHINLESQRIASSYNRSDSLGDRIARVAESAEVVEQKLPGLEDRQRTLEDAMRNSQRDSVTILGIFAAIVIAFGTGTGFAVSSMQTAFEAKDLFALGFIVSLVGLVLAVVMLGLFSYLQSVSRQSNDEMPKVHAFYIGIVLLGFIALLCLLLMLFNSDSLVGEAVRAFAGIGEQQA